jgi:CPA2 family monovalent cation:H+ antiporter-2
MGVAFGAAELFGVSFALGAFFAGMLLNESPFGHKAAEDSLPLRDAFAVLFFVSVGMLFDPMILIEQPLEVLETLAIIVVGKSLAAWAVVRLLGRTNEIALTIAASLAQIGEFSFILIGLGVSLGVMGEDARDLVLAGAILSIMLNPLLFALLARRQQRKAAAAAQPSIIDAPPPIEYVLLIGYGRVGIKLAELLARDGVPFVVVDTDAERIEAARAAGHQAVRGNAADDDVLAEAAPEHAALAVVTVPDALEAGKVIQRLKSGPTPIPVLARAHSDAGVKHLLERGADAAILAEHALAHSLSEMVMSAPPYRRIRMAPQG